MGGNGTNGRGPLWTRGTWNGMEGFQLPVDVCGSCRNGGCRRLSDLASINSNEGRPGETEMVPRWADLGSNDGGKGIPRGGISRELETRGQGIGGGGGGKKTHKMI